MHCTACTGMAWHTCVALHPCRWEGSSPALRASENVFCPAIEQLMRSSKLQHFHRSLALHVLLATAGRPALRFNRVIASSTHPPKFSATPYWQQCDTCHASSEHASQRHRSMTQLLQMPRRVHVAAGRRCSCGQQQMALWTWQAWHSLLVSARWQ